MYEIKETTNFLPLSKLFKRSGLEIEVAEEPAAHTLKMWRIDDAETGNLLAAATIERRKECFVLGQLAVEKEVRNTGLGKTLLDLAEDELKKLGADKIWACAKVPSFYTQYGWEEVDRKTAPNISHCQECEQFGRDCFPSIICKTIDSDEKEGPMYYTTEYQSPLGKIVIAADKTGIAGLWLEGQKYFEDMGEARATEKARTEGFVPASGEQDPRAKEILEKAASWLDRYFDGERPDIEELPLAPTGSEFRRMVWQILCEIPSGQTTTYGEIAKKVAQRTGKKTMSAQAVGGAVGHNPISIIIPCHRVVGTNGSFTGYAGGIDKKIRLLKLEGVDVSKFFVPKKGTAL